MQYEKKIKLPKLPSARGWLRFSTDLFRGSEVPSLGGLTPDEIKRLGNPIFIAPYVPLPYFSDKQAMQEVADWLNQKPNRYEEVDKEWELFLWKFHELLIWHRELWRGTKRTMGNVNKSSCVYRLLNIWAAGRLAYMKRCPYCDRFFVANRETRIFDRNECRVSYQNKVEAKQPQYKRRKRIEQRERRRRAKSDPSYPGSEQTSKTNRAREH